MMVILKFGGKSLENFEKIDKICHYVKQRCIQEKVIMVVSAMGETTNNLLNIYGKYSGQSNHEMATLLSTGETVSASLIAARLAQIGVRARSVQAFQMDLRAMGEANNAVITSMSKSKIQKMFQKNDVLVVTGFQGINSCNQIVTLGRNGSDVTAVALACALDSEVEIFSDFDGIYHGDPRRLPYKKLDEIDYADIKAMAQNGAKVLAKKCVDIAEENNTTIYCKKSDEPNKNGTLVKKSNIQTNSICVIENLSKLTVICKKNIYNILIGAKVALKNAKYCKICAENNKIEIIADKNIINYCEKIIAKTLNLLEESDEGNIHGSYHTI